MAVYLFTGPELGEKQDAIDAIKSTLKKKFNDTEEYLFYATETPVSEYLSLLEGGSFFASATCVLVKAAEVIKNKNEIALIANFSKVKSDTNILILVSDEIKIDTTLDKSITASNKKVFWEMFESKKAPYVTGLFTKNGYKITSDAVNQILDMIENNTLMLRNECAKFFVLFDKSHEITADDVSNVIANTKEETAFSMFAVLTCGDSPSQKLEKVLLILQKLRLSKDNSSFLIIAALTSCFRKVALWLSLKSQNKLDDLSLKVNGFSSKKQKDQYTAAAAIWNKSQVDSILALLSNTDMDIRKNGVATEDTLLIMMIYQIVMKGGKPMQKYELDEPIY